MSCGHHKPSFTCPTCFAFMRAAADLAAREVNAANAIIVDLRAQLDAARGERGRLATMDKVKVIEGELDHNQCVGCAGEDNVYAPCVEGLLDYLYDLDDERKKERGFHGPNLRLRITIEVLDG